MSDWPLALAAVDREREAVQRVMEEACGGRMHYMAVQVGGLKQELPEGWLDRVTDTVDVVRRGLGPFDALLRDTEFRHRTRGVGVLTRNTALAHGVSGPVARASGLDLDLRRARNRPPVRRHHVLGTLRGGARRQHGDCHDRNGAASSHRAASPGFSRLSAASFLFVAVG